MAAAGAARVRRRRLRLGTTGAAPDSPGPPGQPVASLLTGAPPKGSPAASPLAAPSAASFLLACPVPDDLFSGHALPELAVPDTAAAEDSAPGEDAPGGAVQDGDSAESSGLTDSAPADPAPVGSASSAAPADTGPAVGTGSAVAGSAQAEDSAADDATQADDPQTHATLNGAAHNGAAANGGAANGVARKEFRPAVGDSAGLDADRAVTEIYGRQYCSLVRLAALLIGEVGAAEEVVQDSFVDMHSAWSRLRDTETAVSFLRQAVVSRSRWVLPHHARPHPARRLSAMDPALGGSVLRDPTLPPSARPCPAAAAENAAIRAIRELPVGQREALVLRLYLDLPEEQISAAMGISQRAVQDHTASGMAALRAVL